MSLLRSQSNPNTNNSTDKVPLRFKEDKKYFLRSNKWFDSHAAPWNPKWYYVTARGYQYVDGNIKPYITIIPTVGMADTRQTLFIQTKYQDDSDNYQEFVSIKQYPLKLKYGFPDLYAMNEEGSQKAAEEAEFLQKYNS